MEEDKLTYAVIRVIDPILQQPPNQNIPPHVTYEVSGVDPHGEFSIRRRFREFLLLRNKFVERFVGMYIPPISSKRASGNTEEKFVEQRRRFLNYFTQKIAERPYLFDSDIFQTFLRGDPDFERAARYISTHEYALIANIYNIEFRKYAEEADMPKVLIELEKEADILKAVDKQLSNVKEQIQEVIEIKNQFIKDFAYVFKTVVPRYEKVFVRRHDSSGEHEFLTKNELSKAGLEEYLHFCEENPLEDYVEMITYDIREVRALTQAVESRKTFENRKTNFETVRRGSKDELQKLKVGRTTLKSFFTSGKRESQIKDIQSNIDQYERNQNFLGMCLPLSAISVHRDIIRYKTNRSVDYLGRLRVIALKQMRLLDYYGNFLTYGLNRSKN